MVKVSKSWIVIRHSKAKYISNKTKSYCLILCHTGVIFWITKYTNTNLLKVYNVWPVIA